MRSTDHHINPDFNLTELNILQSEAIKPASIEHLSEEEYKVMPVHDPYICYVIHYPDGKHEIRYGDVANLWNIESEPYLMSYNHNRDVYTIYRNDQTIGPIPIVQYADPDDAMRALKLYNVIGSHDRNGIQVYKALLSYIEHTVDMNQCILSIISSMGNRYQTEFQHLQDFLNRFTPDTSISKVATDALMDYMYQVKDHKNILFQVYYDIYLYFVRSSYFLKQQNALRKTDYPNFSKEVQDILQIYQKDTIV